MKRGFGAARSMLAGLLLAMLSPLLFAQELEFRPPPTPTDAGAAAVMRDLAARVLPVYEEKDTDRFLDSLSTIQVIAGNVVPAGSSRQALRERRRAGEGGGGARLVDIYVQALVLQRAGRTLFEQSFGQAFREVVTPMSDLEAFAITGWRMPPLQPLEQGLQREFDRHRGRGVIALPDAVELLRRYFLFDAWRRMAGALEPLVDEDDRRRYAFESVRIPGPGGVRLALDIVRPKNPVRRPPALLEFTILRDERAPLTGPAAHGYAGIVAWTRGSRDAGSRAVPFQYDGVDAAAVIQWIARQRWNDGRVAMQGDGYSGFAAWAAAGQAPPALKAIATADPVAPGIDMPMSGSIFHNESYRWAERVAGSDDGQSSPDDDATWRALDEAWFRSGQRYRDLDRLHGRPNRYFQRWLNHPSYDRFWQDMIPFREGFARVRIPALTVTGYYAANQGGALYYFGEQFKQVPKADHRLVLGPFAQGSGERPAALLRRLPVDAAARIDLTELRYQWFDHVLKGGARPALLRDRVNFLTQGANEWRHAASLAGMGNGTLRFHLDAQPVPGGFLLAQRDRPAATFLRAELSLRDREDYGPVPQADFVTRAPLARHSVIYVSAPLAAAVDVAGVPGGRLDLTTNKLDVDLNVALYELQANGDYVKLFDPDAALRASYARDRVQRQLLRPGRRQQIPFQSERVTSRRLAAGSRLVLVLGINKRPDQQINYGAGNDVSEETIADARYPVRLQLHSSSYVDLPVLERPRAGVPGAGP